MADASAPAREFLDEEFPDELRRLIPTALKRAYSIADRVMHSEAFLRTPGGLFQRGDLVALSAQYELERLALSGSLPFRCTWEDYARPTGKHLVIWTARAKLTVSQIPDPEKKPRQAIFRDNYGLGNMRFLFDFMNEEAKLRNEAKHILLIHGYQSLAFAHLTYPHPDRNEHVYSSDNLMKMVHAVPDDLAKEEGPTESPDPEAMEFLDRALRDKRDE